jgi:hypothetical protein
LTLDVYWDGDPDHERVLLERWNIVYTNGFSAPTDHFDAFDFHGRRHNSNMISSSAKSYAGAGKSRDVVQILREMMKKMAVLLRAVHAFMRLLPAHRFFRQSYPSSLSYEIQSCEESELHRGFEPDVATSYYSFLPINTPFGFVKVATVYRRDCSALERRRKKATKEIFHENFIIQDYVPASPEITAASTPASGTTAVSPQSQSLVPPPSPPSLHRQSSSAPPEDTFGHRLRPSPEAVIDNTTAGRRSSQAHTSQPMAIPHHAKTPGTVTFEERPETVTPALDIPASKPVAIPHHAHSYDDPSRLRAIPPNPNVTAAPYGYGNVAVERSQTPPMGGLSTSSGGFSGSGGGAGSFQEHLLSPHHRPLSTPPRHPNSVLTPRMSGGRTSFVSSVVSGSGGKRSSAHDYAYRSSLENFSLDNSSPGNTAGGATTHQSRTPSPSGSSDHQAHFGGRRSGSFDSQRSATPELPGASSGNLTPPFMAGTPPPTTTGSTVGSSGNVSTGATVLHRTSFDQSPQRTGSPSPSFQANPTELLSTSPGYSHSKHFETLRRGGTPPFTSTDPAFARSSFHFATGSARTASGSILAVTGATARSSGVSDNNGDRAFSTDLQEHSGGIWGISPDSPDTFAISIGASTRRRFLASDEGVHGDGSTTSAKAGESATAYGCGSHTESEMLLLPFALGDDADNLSSGTATTVTATSSVSERPSLGSESDSQPRAGQAATVWDTASVGSFLQQLKNAPRLQTFDSSIERRSSLTSPSGVQQDARGSTVENDPQAASAAEPSFFDDELESFRNLRNELSQTL